MARQKIYEILYEDAFVIVVNKPAGVLSIPGRNADEMSLAHQLRLQDSNLHVVHRLDRDTSGVMIFARDEKTHRALSMQFAERKVKKLYQAIVTGRPAEDEFTLNFKLSVDSHGKAIVSSAGKVALTHCKIVEHFSRYSLLEANPVTGRQHQIRVHLAEIGHPLAVDPIYGSSMPLTIRNIKPGLKNSTQDEFPEAALMQRTPLHALSITFSHPEDNRMMLFHAQMPKDMAATLSQLRKWSR